MAEDYYGGDYLQDICESALVEIGGQALLEDAQDEAGAYVDQHYRGMAAAMNRPSGCPRTAPCCGSGRSWRARSAFTPRAAA